MKDFDKLKALEHIIKVKTFVSDDLKFKLKVRFPQEEEKVVTCENIIDTSHASDASDAK